MGQSRAPKLAVWQLPLLLVTVVPCLPQSVIAAPAWKTTGRWHGIVISKRKVPGKHFHRFRGVGLVNADPYHILAILHDVKRHPEWMHKCSVSKILRRSGKYGYLIYNRIDAPWPFSDRDAIFRATSRTIKRGRRLGARFVGVKSRLMGEVPGVVRFVWVKGIYNLKAAGSQGTLVDYQVEGDAGGWIPRWLANRANKDLPLKTLLALRRQARRTRGWYDRFIAKVKADEAAGAH